MSKPYWHCPVCNGNFDHGERCDCETEKKLIVSESLILGVDISGEEDISCVQVGRATLSGTEIINTLYGKEAEDIYRLLIDRVERKDL